MSSRLMDFVGSCLKVMANKLSRGFGSSPIPTLFSVIVQFASFSACGPCQSSQTNVCKNNFMWNQLQTNAQLFYEYVCIQNFKTILLDQLENGDMKSMSAKSLHD